MENKKRRLCGAKFELLDCEGCVVACGTTDEEGLLCFDNLPLGKYFLREIEAPCGFRTDKCTIPVEVSCKEPCKTLEVFNEKIRGRIKIIKTGC